MHQVQMISRQSGLLRRTLIQSQSRLLSSAKGGSDDDRQGWAGPSRDQEVAGAMSEFLGGRKSLGGLSGSPSSSSGSGGEGESLWTNLRKKYASSDTRGPSSPGGRGPGRGGGRGMGGRGGRGAGAKRDGRGGAQSRGGQGGGRGGGRGGRGRGAPREGLDAPNVEIDEEFDGHGNVKKTQFREDGSHGGGRGAGARRKGKRRDQDEGSKSASRQYDSTNAPIHPAIMALLRPEANLGKRMIRGDTIDKRYMDPVDQFLASFYEESFKTNSGKIDDAIDTDDRKRVQLPKPRSMHQLVQQLQPKINSIDPSISAAAAQGVALGEDVYRVLNDNLFWSEDDKQYMADMTAQLATHHLTDAMNLEAEYLSKATEAGGDLYDGMDMLFHHEFKKGLSGIEHEKKRKAAMEYVAPDTYVQGETDWNEEAVVDEDDL